MTASRILTFVTLGLALARVGGGTSASDSWTEPRPIARDVPAFRAPEEPPDPGVEEPSVAEPEGSIALRDALALALMHNPELAVFSWETRAGEAAALQAGKMANPELDFRVYDLGITRPNVPEDETRYRAMLSQEFELGGKRGKRSDLALAERDVAGWDYETKRIEVATGVTSRFVAVLGGQQRVETLARNVEFFEQTRDRVSALVETGAMRRVEVHQVTRQVGLARIDRQRAEAELSIARFRLAAMWGSRSPRFSEALGELGSPAPLPDIETVIELARHSPAVSQWDAEYARGEAALALAKAGRVPDLTVGAGYRWADERDGEDFLVDVEIPLPFLDRKQGDRRRARFDMARARAGRQAAAATSAEGIAEFYYQVMESGARSRTLREEVVPAARANLEAHRLGLERNADNLGDLLDAQRDLARAEVELTDALVDYHQAHSWLEGIVGQRIGAAE